MIDQSTIGESRTGLRREPETLVIDCSNEPATQHHSGRTSTVKRVVNCKRSNKLESQHAEHQSYTPADWGDQPIDIVGVLLVNVIALSDEVDYFLVACLRSCTANMNFVQTLSIRGLVI